MNPSTFKVAAVQFSSPTRPSPNMKRLLRTAFPGFVYLTCSVPAIAQTVLQPPPTLHSSDLLTVNSCQLTRSTAGRCMESDEHVTLFRRRDAVAAVGVIAVAASLVSADASIARSFQRSSVQTNQGLKRASNIFNTIGFPGSVIMGAATYFIGLGEHSRPVATFGMHSGEAIVLGGVLAEGLQMTIGRARPSRDITDPRDFRFGKGFSNDDYTSLPSAHVTVAFAAATAAAIETRRSWPGATRYVIPIAYGTAALAGMSRMYKNKHWASDVVAGAGLGAYSALLFDRYNRGHPDNILDRVFLPKSVLPENHGVALVWSPLR
jgi:membrane-associated phospholipid phosphatase